MKKTALVLCAFIVFTFLALSQMWSKVYSIFNYVESKGSLSQLKLTSVKGSYEVFIDGNLLGNVKEGQDKEFPQIPEGTRKVKIQRISEVKNF